MRVNFLKNCLTILSLSKSAPITLRQNCLTRFFLYCLHSYSSFCYFSSSSFICFNFQLSCASVAARNSSDRFFDASTTSINSPQPCLRPQAQDPLNLFSSPQIISPLPWRLSFSYSPRQMMPFGQQNYPMPCICPLFHSPLQHFPLNQVYVPCPWKRLASKSPLQYSKNLTLRLCSITKFQFQVMDLGGYLGGTHLQYLLISLFNLCQQMFFSFTKSFTFRIFSEGSFSLSWRASFPSSSKRSFSQALLMNSVKVPLPFFWSFQKSPSQLVNLNFYRPLPFFLPFLNYPVYQQMSQPSLILRQPLPEISPSTKMPRSSELLVKLLPQPCSCTLILRYYWSSQAQRCQATTSSVACLLRAKKEAFSLL